MAGLQEVLDALVGEVRVATAALPHQSIVYAGWPTQANLQQLVAKGLQSHISVYALPGERNATRFAREFAVSRSPAALLTAAVGAGSITFGGTVDGDCNILVRINQEPELLYSVPAGTNLDTVAFGVAFTIASAGIPGIAAEANGPGVVITGDPPPRVAVTIGGTGEVTRLLRQQEKHFMVTAWAPAPDVREALAEAIDGRLGTMDRIPLSDFPGRIRFLSTYEEEPQERLQVFRRSLTYSVEWARTETLAATEVLAARFPIAP